MQNTTQNQIVIDCAQSIAQMDGASDLPAQHAFEGMLAQIATVVGYKELRGEWVATYVAARGCSEKSAQNRWAELCSLCGFTKPQNPEAAAKAAQRAKRGPTQPKAEKAGATPTTPATGREAGLQALQATLDRVQLDMLDALLSHDWARLEDLAAAEASRCAERDAKRAARDRELILVERIDV